MAKRAHGEVMQRVDSVRRRPPSSPTFFFYADAVCKFSAASNSNSSSFVGLLRAPKSCMMSSRDREEVRAGGQSVSGT